MKLDAIKFGLACAIALATSWMICVLFVMIMPFGMMEMSGNMLHMDVSGMKWDMGFHGLIVGTVAWAIVGGFIGGLIATTYNRL